MAIGQDHQMQAEGRKEKLSEAKRRLLQQRMGGVPPQKENDRIRARPAGTRVPLSAEQRRIWLHASEQPDLPIYNEPFTTHRYGSFDLGTLEASINEIVRRHDAWRTSFSLEGEAVIHDTVRVTLPLIDLSELPEAEREAEALRIATDDAQRPIPVHDVPLFRACVVRMKADEHRLYLTVHHIIFDAVSISRIFVPELSAIYASFEQGKPSALPRRLDYGDYAIWRERHVDSAPVKKHLAYWLEHLSGELPILRLPEDHPHPTITNYRGSMERFKISKELMENLRRLSHARGVTLYMTLLAVFKVLLFRYTAQNDLIVGSATDARRQSELEGVMGCFVDTFAVRTRPDAELRFSEYLAQTRDAVLGGLAAADVPFDRVVQRINPKRDPSHHPIFQAFFSIRPPMPTFPEGWNLTQMDVTVGTSKFVLHLELCERPDQIEARFFYSTAIWNASTIRRMVTHWLVLLQSVRQNPESTLNTLAMLTSEETAALLGPGGWNDTARPFPQVTLNELFEEHVRRTPHAIAATFGNETLTYRELNLRANAIASLLRAAGITRGSIVAIRLDRSLNLLAGLIAVLKTGAAYLPVDIHMPREQIARYLADAEPSAILTQYAIAHQIAPGSTAVVLVDGNQDSQALAATGAVASEPTQSTDSLEDSAYLIYTSGTTGEPKAVEISQRSLVNLLAAMQTAPGFGPGDVFLAVTPISFDIAALELFLPVISGGKVVIATREEAQDPYLLAEAIRHSGCTVMQATPATWRTLLLSGWDNAQQNSTRPSSRIQRALCGGDVLPRELANRLLAVGVELWNMYGPTEATAWSLTYRVHPETENQAGPVPIGRPIANTRAYVLDQQRQLLPVGVPGELFLGGLGLAKGYRGRPQLTADRFITVESVGGIRLYRTGDIAVQKSDGTIEVLGRTDNQVKIRGHRVELEAVEAALLRHPLVTAAAVRAWPESSSEFRLSAYIVANGAPVPSLDNLRAFLGRGLPDYMIPSDVIPLPAIPLTPHGKVDRARLPAPTAGEAGPLQTAVQSCEQAQLAAIWADLLGSKHVGLDDDFFDLGGHSLLVAMLQQRIAAELGLRIPMADLSHSPTIRQQAELARKLVKGESLLPAGVLALQPHGAGNSIFWVQSLNANLAKAIGKDHPLFMVGLTAEEVASLGQAPTLQIIAERHVRKILATQPTGPYVLGGQCAAGILAFETARQLQASGREVSVLVILDAPNLSHLEDHDSLRLKLDYPFYALKRAARLGLRTSLVYFRQHMRVRSARRKKPESPRTEMRVTREMIEEAARLYKPEKYEGNVLLLLASDRPPHKDFLPGWQAIVPHNLHTHFVDGHHLELANPQNVPLVVGAIVSHLISATDNQSPSIP